MDRDGEGEGGFLFGSGEGVLGGLAGSGRWVCVSGTEIRSGGASGGVLTDTRPGIVLQYEVEIFGEGGSRAERGEIGEKGKRERSN